MFNIVVTNVILRIQMRRNTALLSIIVMLICFSSIQVPQTVATMTPEDVDVLAVIGGSFGWSYFELRDFFEGWGCNFTTTGESAIVQSCVNKPANPVETDILVSEIDRDIIRQFDVLVVPSGGHWQNLRNSAPVINLIQMAYEEGLVVGGICVGVIPVAWSNVTFHKVITGHDFVYTYAIISDATIHPLMNSVIDGQIVTGDGGDGVPDGYETAPHFEFCRAVMMKALGYTYFQDVSIQPVLNGNETVYQINVTTSESMTMFSNVTIPEVAEVTAKFHTETNETIFAQTDLADPEGDGLFTGNITGLETGRYVIDLDIVDANVSLEVVRDVLAFDATSTHPTTSAGTGLPLVLETTVIVGAAAIIVIVALVIWRKR
ncbi:MAG: DJ-1/PfpI family protein [Candidatus Thorarchaeota archaeon]